MLREGSKVLVGPETKSVAEVKVCKVCGKRIVRLTRSDIWLHEHFLEEGIRPNPIHPARP